MSKAHWILALLLAGIGPVASWAQDTAVVSSRYKALKCPIASQGSTWAVLDRNGANAKVDPYLSSLGQGEAGTGEITSPPFKITVDKIAFTICGHDGQAGGRGENYVALVDARKGNVLLKATPPQNDALQEREWDVKGVRGEEVRIEVHDGNGGGAFAWLGVGRIDAGEALRVDFRDGMPKGWDQPELKAEIAYQTVTGGISFKQDSNTFTLIPRSGSVEIPCGFSADRLFFLGCTVNAPKPLDTRGSIEIHYRSGSPDIVPLMCGFTLDGPYKLLSPSKAMYLHASGDPYQHYLVIKPRSEVIEKIRLVAQPQGSPVPRISAITCETSAAAEQLMPLPESPLSAEESTWIQSHAVSANSPDLAGIEQEIRRSNKLPGEAKATNAGR